MGLCMVSRTSPVGRPRIIMAEYYRQFAFVSSVLAGFAFTFYGTLLVASRKHGAGSWAAFMAISASVAFLPVTLGMTFGAVRAAHLPEGEIKVYEAFAQPQIIFLSMLFLAGIIFLFASFGLSGWMHSRKLGLATTVLAALGLAGALAALLPYIHVDSRAQ